MELIQKNDGVLTAGQKTDRVQQRRPQPQISAAGT
jgi:hypothetical protein